MESPHQRFFVNVYNNSGTVVVGSHNIVNVHPLATRSVTSLQRENIVAISHERVAEDGLQIVRFGCSVEQSSVAKSQSSSRVSCLSGSFAKGENVEKMKISNFFQVVKNEQQYRECKREKTKRNLGEEGEKLKRKRRGRKRIKRRKRNSRSSTTSSDEDLKGTTLYELPFESNSSSFQEGLQSFYFYCTHLHPLRDNGQWSKFDVLAQQLLGQVGSDLTSRILICLEKSVALCYQKKVEESEELIKDAEKRIAQTSGSVRLLLEMLSNCYRAGLYRRRKIFGQGRPGFLGIWYSGAF